MRNLIYHIITGPACEAWRFSSDYEADSLLTEGFIHCSKREQMAWVANQFYADQSDLRYLVIDVDLLTSPLRYEDPGTGELFPHVYGPIVRDAIMAISYFQRGPDGQWLPPHLPLNS
jgi:uncharacterized protein (DUF952 family)